MRFLACVVALAALAAAAVPGTRPLTPEQALQLRRISDLQFSPDGARLAFVVAEPPKGAENARHIWMLQVADGASRQYTYSAKTETSPRWSPDGKFLAFLSDRDQNRQIYLAPSDGGDAYAVTTGKRSISAFAWSPDGRQIAFLAPEDQAEARAKQIADKDDARVVDQDGQRARLWILDLASRQAKPLTPENWQVRDLAWLPSGNALVMSATDHPESDRNTQRIFTIPVSGGAMSLLAAPTGPFSTLRVSPDGTQLAYLGARVDGPQPHDIYVRALTAPADLPSRNLSAAGLDRAISGLEWRSDRELVATAQQGFHSALEFVTTAGIVTSQSGMEPNPRAVAVEKGGRFAFVGETATTPPEVYLAGAGTAPKRVTHLNATWDGVALAQPRELHFPSFDGVPIDGRLLVPANAGSGPLPLVVLVHGGPTGAWSDAIEPWGQLLAANGIAAAYFNIRGSTGYGEHFLESNRADWGGADFKDVMAGVDYLVKQGIADPHHLGIGGWSYGGYMAEWAITQTDRFQAAVSGAGMVDLISEFSTENGPAYDQWFWGLPYERSAIMLQHSPLLYLQHAHTPILILQGINDTTDPLGESTGLYRGLKYYGAPAELVEYPRENHGFQEEKHQIDRLNRIVAWYGKYLKPAAATAVR